MIETKLLQIWRYNNWIVYTIVYSLNYYKFEGWNYTDQKCVFILNISMVSMFLNMRDFPNMRLI